MEMSPSLMMHLEGIILYHIFKFLQNNYYFLLFSSYRLNDLSRSISNNVDELVVKVEGERAGLQENELLLNQTSDHANQLAEEVFNMETTVETAKNLAAEPLKAANAYQDIKKGLDNAKSAVESAVAASNEAASKVNNIHFSN